MSHTPPPSEGFGTTRWSIVLAAGADESDASRAALDSLCATYWYPLYAFVRRRGYSQTDAEDLTQGFFTSLLARDALLDVRPEKGKFRAYLLSCMKHFLSNERDRDRTLRRGGGRTRLSLDIAAAERKTSLEPMDERTPEACFLRDWAVTLLEQTLSELRREFEADDRAELFDCLKLYLTGEAVMKQSEVADSFGMTHDAVKAAVYRLRERFRRRLRAAVADTVVDPADVEDEIRDLMAALA